MKMRLFELQDNNKETRKLRVEKLPEGWKDIKEVFHYRSFPYILKIICSKLICRHYDNLLLGHFRIKKTQ